LRFLKSAGKYLASSLIGSGIRQEYAIHDNTVIGTGRFGSVVLAQDKSSGQKVAVKKFKKPGMNEQMLGKIRHEIGILKKIKHPNCIQFQKVFESGKHIYIVMELMEGGELLDRIIEQDHYNESEAAHCFYQIMSAVSYLHSVGIVHRDLKPENILYADKSRDSCIKIADFGLGKVVDVAAVTSGRARIYSRCGSPNFCAPEVFGDAGYGMKVDVWSAGCILYILLCGFLPFEQQEYHSQDKSSETIFLPRIKIPDFPSPYWDSISEDAKQLILSMLTIQPKERITAAQGLQSTWITKYKAGKLSQENLPQLQGRLKLLSERKLMGAVHSLTALRRMRKDLDWASLHRIIRQEAAERLAQVKLDPAWEATLKESFSLLDRDQSGRISVENLADSMTALGNRLTTKEVHAMMERFDLFKTGDITFEEYCIMMAGPQGSMAGVEDPGTMDDSSDESESSSSASKEVEGASRSGSLTRGSSDSSFRGSRKGLFRIKSFQVEELGETFRSLDVDHSGSINADNLAEIMKRLGKHVSHQEAQEMVKIADVKGNGVIDFDEFSKMMEVHTLEGSTSNPEAVQYSEPVPVPTRSSSLGHERDVPGGSISDTPFAEVVRDYTLMVNGNETFGGAHDDYDDYDDPMDEIDDDVTA